LTVTRVTRADLDHDGQSETIVEAATRAGKQPGHVEDHALSYVGVAKGEPAHPKWADVYRHFAPKAKAADDLFAASVYGKLAGLADLNGDDRPEIILETGYYEGGGLAIYSYRDGEVTKLGDNSCGL
jgi:hypothetical protein